MIIIANTILPRETNQFIRCLVRQLTPVSKDIDFPFRLENYWIRLLIDCLVFPIFIAKLHFIRKVYMAQLLNKLMMILLYTLCLYVHTRNAETD